MKTRVKTTCLLLMALGLSTLFAYDDVAAATVGKECEPAANQGTAKQAEETLPAPMPRRLSLQNSHSEASHSRGIGNFINGFLAFGCRTNYRLLDWALSDKCDTGDLRYDCSQKMPREQ